MPMTRFSIIITSHNQREFIKDAVDSALVQTKAGMEIVVVDDGSTDGSLEVLRRYGEAIRLVCLETNQGACIARNRGAALAAGEYLVFLDGDDAFPPWALDVYDRIVEARKPMVILGSHCWFKGSLPFVQAADAPREIRFFEYGDNLRRDRSFHEPTAKVIERRTFQGTRGWSQDAWPMEHSDLLLRLCGPGPAIMILTPPTTLYRIHAQNSSRHPRHVVVEIACLSKTIRNEQLGIYPGGKHRGFDRRAFIGNRVYVVARGAIRAGQHWDALKLLARGWPMFLAAVARKLVVPLKGRQPCETMEL